MIHPTAIIEPGATLGSNVHVGPYSCIGRDVTLGDGCHVGPHVVITGDTTCGINNKFYQFSSIGEAPQEKQESGDATSLVIGDNNIFRESATVHRGTKKDRGVTQIGSHNLFMAYTHVAHDASIGDHVIFSNNATVAGHVRVDDWAILSGGASVHQFGMIGAHAFLGGHAGAVKDVPPFVMAMGTPATPFAYNIEGMKRRGFSREEIKSVRQIYKLLYRSNLLLKDARDAIEALPSESAKVMVAFLDNTQRGIVR